MYVHSVLKCYSLGDNLLRRLVECVCCVTNSGLKCQLSGDAPQGSQSLINDVNYYVCVCYDLNPITVTYTQIQYMFLTLDIHAVILFAQLNKYDSYIYVHYFTNSFFLLCIYSLKWCT